MAYVNNIFKHLADNGLRTKPLKCEWSVECTNFLGYNMMPTKCKQMNKKVEALLQMQEPHNRKKLQNFIDGINYYKMMWP